jgi:hypothetical protein
MADRITVSYEGQQYEAVRRERGSSGEPGEVWQVLRDGALVTSFPAEPSDGSAEVREKVVGWLQANEARPTLDIGRQ